jgi:hypothetical protein
VAKVPVHTDPRVQLLLEQVRERESAQGIDRLRLVHRQWPAKVIVLSNLPLDVTVDQLVTWRDIIPSRLERAVARADAVPLSKAELARAHPDLWPSAAAVEIDLRREKGDISLVVDSIWGLSPFSVRVAYWRTPSQRKPYRAVLRDGRDPRAALEAVVGPVLRVRVEPATDAKDDTDSATEATDEVPP